MEGGGSERINLYNILKQREERDLGLRLMQWRLNRRVRAVNLAAMSAVGNYVPPATGDAPVGTNATATAGTDTGDSDLLDGGAIVGAQRPTCQATPDASACLTPRDRSARAVDNYRSITKDISAIA